LTALGKASASASGVHFTVSCQASPGGSCKGLGALTTLERLQGNHIVGLSARTRSKRTGVGRATFTVATGQRRTVFVKLNPTGRKLLGRFRKLPLTLTVTLSNGASGKPTTILKTKLIARPAKRRKGHH
jgi:hypothetical protein